jgi:hypothetical protein
MLEEVLGKKLEGTETPNISFYISYNSSRVIYSL